MKYKYFCKFANNPAQSNSVTISILVKNNSWSIDITMREAFLYS